MVPCEDADFADFYPIKEGQESQVKEHQDAKQFFCPKIDDDTKEFMYLLNRIDDDVYNNIEITFAMC